MFLWAKIEWAYRENRILNSHQPRSTRLLAARRYRRFDFWLFSSIPLDAVDTLNPLFPSSLRLHWADDGLPETIEGWIRADEKDGLPERTASSLHDRSNWLWSSVQLVVWPLVLLWLAISTPPHADPVLWLASVRGLVLLFQSVDSLASNAIQCSMNTLWPIHEWREINPEYCDIPTTEDLI